MEHRLPAGKERGIQKIKHALSEVEVDFKMLSFSIICIKLMYCHINFYTDVDNTQPRFLIILVNKGAGNYYLVALQVNNQIFNFL